LATARDEHDAHSVGSGIEQPNAVIFARGAHRERSHDMRPNAVIAAARISAPHDRNHLNLA